MIYSIKVINKNGQSAALSIASNIQDAKNAVNMLMVFNTIKNDNIKWCLVPRNPAIWEHAGSFTVYQTKNHWWKIKVTVKED